MNELEPVLTMDELAKYLKVGKTTLYRLAQERRIPGQKIGKHWRFSREAIDRWLDDGCRESFRRRGNPEGNAHLDH